MLIETMSLEIVGEQLLNNKLTILEEMCGIRYEMKNIQLVNGQKYPDINTIKQGIIL
jgi:hypothetical protein